MASFQLLECPSIPWKRRPSWNTYPNNLLYNSLSKIDELLPLRCYTVDEYPHFCKFLEFCGLRQRSGLHPPTHPPTGGRPRGAVSARKIPKICKNVGIHRPCSIYWAIFHQFFKKYLVDGYQLRVYLFYIKHIIICK